ncbi:hypothetical protein BH23CHL8_BH23CHL8_31000 [soil metagenome]
MPSGTFDRDGTPVDPDSPDATVRVTEPEPERRGRRVTVDARGNRVPDGSPRGAYIYDEDAPQLARLRARAR